MFENLLTDQLTLAVTVGGEPNPLGGAQRTSLAWLDFSVMTI
jgi:hypothetical protein